MLPYGYYIKNDHINKKIDRQKAKKIIEDEILDLIDDRQKTKPETVTEQLQMWEEREEIYNE